MNNTKGYIGCLTFLILAGILYYLYYDYTKEHEAVKLTSTELKEYITKNHDQLKKDDAKLAKKICFQIFYRLNALKENKKQTENLLENYKYLEDSTEKRKNRINDLKTEISSKSYTSDLDKLERDLSSSKTKVDSLQKRNSEIKEQLKVLEKLDSKKNKESLTNELLSNTNKVEELLKKEAVLKKNGLLLKELLGLEALEANRDSRLKEMANLPEKIQSIGDQIKDHEEKITSLEKVYSFSLEEENSIWAASLIFWTIVVICIVCLIFFLLLGNILAFFGIV